MLSEQLVDESFIIPEPEFKRLKVIDPDTDDSYLRLPGLGTYLPDLDSPRHVVLTPEVMKLYKPFV